jgi:superfamily II DNA or RNA helicase
LLDLFSQKTDLKLPPRFEIRGRLCGKLICQVTALQFQASFQVLEKSERNSRYFRLQDANGEQLAVSASKKSSFDGIQAVLRIARHVDLAELPVAVSSPSARWSNPKPAQPTTASEKLFGEIRDAWRAGWRLVAERYEVDTLVEAGLRPPQMGAIHAVKAHWVVSDKPATIVMPTGTGKTETMLALFVSEPIQKLMVVVPNDALRHQIGMKFVTLGELKRLGCLPPNAPHPVVGFLKGGLKNLEEVDAFCRHSQVIVTTMQSIAVMGSELQARLADHVTHLFIDEAHHIAASTWKDLKRRFLAKNRIVLQFTATPYRSDDRRVDGRHVFSYPLKRALDQKLFRKIDFVPVKVVGQGRIDEEIVRLVGETLDRDIALGFDHIAMARVDSIARAEALLPIYRKALPRHTVEVVNSKMNTRDKEAAIERLRKGETRIIICVDMLGEGFDLPQLKIAGLHNPQKSEAVTFQLIGRFTRQHPNLGDATVIAPVSREDPHAFLNALYRDDADWHHLLPQRASKRIATEQQREQLFAELGHFEEIPESLITPKLSTVVYTAACPRWDPAKLGELESRASWVDGPLINEEAAFAMVVTRHEDKIRWTRVKSPTDVRFNLLMLHWDEDQRLLYVHTSDDLGLAHVAAKLVTEGTAEPITGEIVFRALHGYRQIMLNVLGVKEAESKPVRFQLSSGVDITPALEAEASNRSRVKTNLFGSGYIDEVFEDEDGEQLRQTVKRTIGCSTKGKIYTSETAVDPAAWISWSKSIGPKLVDSTISTDHVIKNILRPKRQQTRPARLVPVSVDWPETFTLSDEARYELVINGKSASLTDCSIELLEHGDSGPIRFSVRADAAGAEISFNITDGVATYRTQAGSTIVLKTGKREMTIEEAFRQTPPVVRFASGDVLFGSDMVTTLGPDDLLFDVGMIEALDWKDVDITKESQGPQRQPGTVQRFVIDRLLASKQPYDLIFDGDAAGEIADVVAIRRQGKVLDIELYHCKFSSESTPGSRIKDLYEVCGQAMKSVRWADRRSLFFQKMIRQEGQRQEAMAGAVGVMHSRVQHGDPDLLDEWMSSRRMMERRFKAVIVQPGYSKARAVPEHMPLLGSVRSYLAQTYNVGFGVWISP